MAIPRYYFPPGDIYSLASAIHAGMWVRVLHSGGRDESLWTKFGWVTYIYVYITYIYTMPQMSRNYKMLNYYVLVPTYLWDPKIPQSFWFIPNVPKSILSCVWRQYMVFCHDYIIFHFKRVDDYTPLPSSSME